MALHNALTGAELHEPKGVETASSGMMYVADGSGSGVWKYAPSGFGLYEDTTTQVFTTTASRLVSNGLGADSTEVYLPRAIRGVTSLWSTGTNRVTPIAVGDVLCISLELPVTVLGGAAASIEVTLDIGGEATPTNVIAVKDINLAKSPPFTKSESLHISVPALFATNGGQIFMKADAGTVTVANPSVKVIRIHGEI